MRDQPAGVGHVAEEPAAELVAKAERRHGLEGETQKYLELAVRLEALPVQQQRELRDGRELLLLAESPRETVGGLRRMLHERVAEGAHVVRIHHRARCRWTPRAREKVGDLACGGTQLFAIGRPSGREPFEKPDEVLHREIGEPDQRKAVRGQHDVEGPARVALRRLHELDELRVEGRIELAIDLCGQEVLVEQGGRLGIREALALHHVAPVTGEVAHGDEDQPVVGFGPRSELRAPFLPVHRVVRVQPQVG